MDHTKAKLVKCIKSGNMFMFSNSESNVMDANYSCLVDKESLPWYIRGHVGFSQEVEEKIDIPRRKNVGPH